MKLKKPLKKLLTLLVSSSLLGGCINLDLIPVTLDVESMKGYVRPTNHNKPNVDLDLTNRSDFEQLHKFTCFSPDDVAQLQRALNNCK